MKYAKMVVLGQLGLAAVLVGVMMLKPKPGPGGGHGEAVAVAVAAEHAGAGEKGEHGPGGGHAGAEKAGEKKGSGGHDEAGEDKDGHGKGDKAGKGGKGEDDKGDKGGPDDGAKGQGGGSAAVAAAVAAGAGHGTGAPEHEGDGALGDEPREIAKALLAGNARFSSGEAAHPDLLQQVAGSKDGQHPGAMILGCADSRVPPELIFGRGIGELFVVRSAGNVAEPVSAASLEYAVEHLHTKVLVVLGHEKCGAVQAALAGGKLPSSNLETLVEHITPAVKGLKAWVDGPDLVRLAVEANVRYQAQELLRRSRLLRNAVAKGEVTILKAVYDLETGRVRPL